MTLKEIADRATKAAVDVAESAKATSNPDLAMQTAILQKLTEISILLAVRHKVDPISS